MKTIQLLLAIILISMAGDVNAQLLKKIKKRAKNASERRILREVEKKADQETDKAIDKVLNPEEAKKEKEKQEKAKKEKASNTESPADEKQSTDELTEKGDSKDSQEEKTEVEEKPFEVYSKFNFIAGDKILLYDDFSVDELGDFPAKWDADGSGELVTFNDEEQKWLQLVNNTTYVPMMDALPKNFTIEFDVMSKNLSSQTSSGAKLKINLEEDKTFEKTKNRSGVHISFCQYISTGISVAKYSENKKIIYNNIQKDLRKVVLEPMHISIAGNKSRLRIWVNENKVVDIPRLINNDKTQYFRLESGGFKDGEEAIFLSNFKITEGKLDLRSLLDKDGKFSTTGILFDSGSANIKPESYGILKKIADLLKKDNIKMNIIGHTDSDGADDLNLKLSQERSEAVKQILVSQFGVDGSLLTFEGKGEVDPVADNSTTEGKAQNRRVEFVKL